MFETLIPAAAPNLRKGYQLACHKHNLNFIWYFSFASTLIFALCLTCHLGFNSQIFAASPVYHSFAYSTGLILSLANIFILAKSRQSASAITMALVSAYFYVSSMAAISVYLTVISVDGEIGASAFILVMMVIPILLQGHFGALLLLLLASWGAMTAALLWIYSLEQFSAAVSLGLIAIGLAAVLGYLHEQALVRQFERLQQLDDDNKLLVQLSNQDPLTGLNNRRSFEYILDKEIARSRRYGKALSLLMIDVDGFKTINDQHGHLTGDTVLKDVAELIERQIRDIDEVSRYGGDEFLVLLVEADFKHSIEIAERIRELVENHAVDELNNKLSVSIGHIQFDRDSREELIKNADYAMYQAKKQGKNRVISYLPPAND